MHAIIANAVPLSAAHGTAAAGPGRRSRLLSQPITTANTNQAWLPDGYSQILRLYVFGPLPSGLKDYGSATLRCKF